MESELVSLLNKVQEDLKKEIEGYINENEKITNLNHVQTKEDRKRREKLIELKMSAERKLKDLGEDLSYITNLEDEIEGLEEDLDVMTDKTTRRAQRIQEKIKLKKEEYEELKAELETKYQMPDKKQEEIMEEEKLMRKEDRKAKLSLIAICLAIGGIAGLTGGIYYGTKNKHNTNNGTNPQPAPSSSSIEEYTEENTNNIEQGLALVEEDGELFVDIFDEEQVALRAEEEVLNYYDELVPNLGFTNEDAEELLKWMNNGKPKEVSQSEALNQVNTFEALLNNEINYSVDMVNKGDSLREEQNTVVDYGKFFIDGSKTQELATKVNEFRIDMLLDPKNGKESAIGFTNLLMKSWYLDGCDGEEISAYRLESSSNKVFIDKLFLNTAMLAGAYGNITVINPLDGKEISLQDLIKEINQANCPAQLIADNGDVVNTYVNKFTYDMEGMLAELTYNKENIKTRSLTK